LDGYGDVRYKLFIIKYIGEILSYECSEMMHCIYW
jgi:hypothetical protein